MVFVRGRTIRVMALLASGLTACATPRAPDRARVASAITERAGVGSKGLRPGGREWMLPPDISLDDGLTIDEAVATALWNNPDFQTALTSLGLARADLIEAGLLRNPVFSLLFPWGPKQLEMTITWPIDAIWQRPKRIENARLNAESSAEQIVANGLRLAGDVRLAFLDVLIADRRLVFTIEQSGIASQIAAMADSRLRGGDISEFEAHLAGADALRLQATQLNRVSARDLAIVRLRALLGLDQQAPPLQLREPAMVVTDGCAAAPDLFRAALAARPEIRAAEMQIEAAGARAGLERARILAFTATLDANGQGSEGFEMGPGAQIELPVFSQNQGGRARAAAELEQAGRRYLAAQASVTAEIGAALVGLTEARHTAGLLGANVAAALAAARRQAESLYSAGEISLLILLETRLRLIDLEATRVDADFGVNRAIVRLEQAVGNTCGPR